MNLLCKWAQIGPIFRCWNMRTQILLIPCLLNHQKMPPFGSFCQKIHSRAFFKKVFLQRGLGKRGLVSIKGMLKILKPWSQQVNISVSRGTKLQTWEWQLLKKISTLMKLSEKRGRNITLWRWTLNTQYKGLKKITWNC